jgi:hypothetical protein
LPARLPLPLLPCLGTCEPWQHLLAPDERATDLKYPAHSRNLLHIFSSVLCIHPALLASSVSSIAIISEDPIRQCLRQQVIMGPTIKSFFQRPHANVPLCAEHTHNLGLQV